MGIVDRLPAQRAGHECRDGQDNERNRNDDCGDFPPQRRQSMRAQIRIRFVHDRRLPRDDLIALPIK